LLTRTSSSVAMSNKAQKRPNS